MATAFALSIFSTLLLHSYQRIVQIVVSAVSTKHRDSESKGAAGVSSIADCLEHGKSIVSVLLEHSVATAAMPQPAVAETEGTTAASKADVKPATALEGSPAKKKHRVVDRRRTRKVGGEREKLDEEEGEESDSDGDLDGSIGGSSNGSLSVLSEDLGEDDLELLDSLSDSSTSEPEEDDSDKKPETVEAPSSGDTPTDPATGVAPGKKTGRRQIILAANFTMPPAIAPHDSGGRVKGSAFPSPAQGQPSPKADRQLGELVKNTAIQTSVYTACSLVAEESGLMALRVFIYWLQSYPIIIATCTQVRWFVGMGHPS